MRSDRTRRARGRALAWALAGLVLGILLLALPSSAAAAPPANDNFASALVLAAGPSTVTGTNLQASKETGEPNHAGYAGGVSVWYSWTPTSSRLVTVDTFGSDFDTLLAVYTGTSVGALTEVASNDQSGGNQSKVTFSVTAGTTYSIAVDGWTAITGNITLHVDPPPANDNLGAAQALTGTAVRATGSNAGATKEAGEPNHGGDAGGRSVWYSWPAPAGGGTVTINTSASNFNTLLGVYTGTGYANLALVAQNDDESPTSTRSSVTFAATGGTTYLIAVDGFGGVAGQISLAVNPPANDMYAAAAPVTGSSATLSGYNTIASKEVGEPNHGGNSGGASVWYAWTAPASGRLLIDTFGSSFNTTLGVYTGSSVSALTLVAGNDQAGGGNQSQVEIAATGGTTYYIAVDGAWGATGTVTLHVNPAPANDAFASATAIAGSSTNLSGVTLGATRETGEPDHAAAAGTMSVWYTWTAPAAGGPVTINTYGSDYNTTLGVYTGTSVGSLTLVASNDDAGGGTQSRITFTATGGATYAIAVDGAAGAHGRLRLNLGGASNDDFTAATSITTSAATVSGSTVGASRESGEPAHAGLTGGSSIWYAWTAPAGGPALVDTVGSSFDTLLGVYTGASVGALTMVASDDNAASPQSRVTFTAVGGTTYYIAIDGKAAVTGSSTLRINPPPTNDAFANAQVLSGNAPTASGWTIGASRENGEPSHAGVAGSASVWYIWTAPVGSASTIVETTGSSFDTTLGVYTGGGVGTLTSIASNDDSNGLQSVATFTAVPGTTYRIAVDGKATATGIVALRIRQPNNDMFASAINIPGTRATVIANNFDATRETGEPVAAGSSLSSLWWTWTAPANATVVVNTAGSNFDTVLGIYTGTAVDALTLVASNDDSIGLQSSLSFSATAGTTYRIVVASYGSVTGNIRLNVNPAANNDYAAAQAITGSVTGTNVGASAESGERLHATTGTSSIWYKWTSPAAGGSTVFDTAGSDFDTVLAVYTGTAVGSLTLIVENDDFGGTPQSRVSFSATGNTAYYIAVDGRAGLQGSATLRLNPVAPSAPTHVTPANGSWVRSLTPTLTATYQNSGGGSGFVTFELCTSSATDPWSSNCGTSYQTGRSAGLVAAGSNASWAPNTSLVELGTYYWRARGTDAFGNSGPWSTSTSFRVDTIAPTAPPNTRTTVSGNGSITVEWNASSDIGSGLADYIVETSTGDGTWTTAACSPTTGTSCKIGGLGNSTRLFMRVSARDVAGNVSGWSYYSDSSAAGYYLRTTTAWYSTLLTATANRQATLTADPTGLTGTSVTLSNTSNVWYQFQPGAANATAAAGQPSAAPATPTGIGWVVEDVRGKTVKAGPIQVTAQTNATSGNGVAAVECRAWIVTVASGSITSATSLGRTLTIGDVSNNTTTNTACDLPGFTSQTTFGMDQALYVELWLNVTSGGGGSPRVSLTTDNMASLVSLGAPGSSPNVPTLVSPASGTVVPSTATLTAGYSHPTPVNGSVEFQLSSDGFTTIADSGFSSLVASGTDVSFTSQALAPGTYYWRARAADANGLLSAWTTTSTAVVVNGPPATPVNQSPATGGTATLTPTLTASAFSDPNSGQAHAASEWQLRTADGSYLAPLAASGTTSSSLTSWAVGTTLSEGATFYWRVRYRDALGAWSPWSLETSFVARTPPPSSVTVTGATPSSLRQGTTTTVTLSGTAFANGAAVTFSGTGLSAVSTTVVSSTQIDVAVSTSTTAAIGLRDVTVTNTDTTSGTGTGLVTITALSLTISLDASTVAMPLVNPGSSSAATTTATVTTDHARGYSLSAVDAHDSIGASCPCGSIPDWTARTPQEPTQWPTGTAGYWGAGVLSATGGRLAKWGPAGSWTATDYDNNWYVGLLAGSPTELHRAATASSASGDQIVVLHRVAPALEQVSGTYVATVSLTATANP